MLYSGTLRGLLLLIISVDEAELNPPAAPPLTEDDRAITHQQEH